jgi:hypothetical protein
VSLSFCSTRAFSIRVRMATTIPSGLGWIKLYPQTQIRLRSRNHLHSYTHSHTQRAHTQPNRRRFWKSNQ